eukprot:6175416-Pleurochrysis_carterae.AAC.1
MGAKREVEGIGWRRWPDPPSYAEITRNRAAWTQKRNANITQIQHIRCGLTGVHKESHLWRRALKWSQSRRSLDHVDQLVEQWEHGKGGSVGLHGALERFEEQIEARVDQGESQAVIVHLCRFAGHRHRLVQVGALPRQQLACKLLHVRVEPATALRQLATRRSREWR